MSKASFEDRLRLGFNSQNFIDAPDLAVNFKFRPDLILKNENTIRAFIIRKSSGIPVEFITRYSESEPIEGYSIEKYIAFSAKPDETVISNCVDKHGVAVCYLSRGKIQTILPQDGFGILKSMVVTEARYEMPHTVIFFSSIEELPERHRGKHIVKRINEKYKKSIWANLVERDKSKKVMTSNELMKEIRTSIEQDEYFLGILAEDYASAVEFEVQTAINIKPFENIILLVKDNDITRNSWRDLLNDISIKFQTRGRTIWYMKYNDIEDFEETLRKEILELISKKYKMNNTTLL